MSQSDDLPPPRRALFFPVVLATVFLTIIGISAGRVLGDEAQDRRNAAGQQQQQTQPQQSEQQPQESTPAPDGTRGAECRSETQLKAHEVNAVGTLTQLLRVRTKTSVVYICADDEGRMFYHANRGGSTWIENQTALFLPGVVRGDDDYHVTAINDGTTFSVNKKRLFILHADGRAETQPVIG